MKNIYVLDEFCLSFNSRKNAELYCSLQNIDFSNIKTYTLISSKNEVELLSDHLNHSINEKQRKIDEYRKTHQYQRKWSLINNDDTFYWRHLTPTDLEMFEENVLKDISQYYSSQSILKRLQQGLSININLVGGFNTFTPDIVIEADSRPQISDHLRNKNSGLSGWITPEGLYRECFFTEHSRTLNELLVNEKLKEMYHNGYAFVYLTSHKSQLTFNHESHVKIDGTIITDELKQAIRRLSPYMTSSQRQSIEQQLGGLN